MTLERRRTATLALSALALLTVVILGRWPVAAQDARRVAAGTGAPIKVLFLGHDSDHHPSAKLFPPLAAALARRGIQLTYVSQPAAALDPDKLKYYDAL